jgi:hypothetical protein
MLHALLLITAGLSGATLAQERPARLPDAVHAPGAEAQYGLFRFGGSEPVSMWAVFAKSSAAAPAHDLLFLDLDADGDLTDPAERFVGGPEQGYSEAVRGFDVGRLAVPGTGEVHTGVHLVHYGWKVEWSLCWRGATWLRGGVGRGWRDGVFGARPEDAPVFTPRLDRPLQFLEYENRAVPVGRTGWFRVVAGARGLGRGSFSRIDTDALPAGEVLLATLHYVDQDGTRRERAFELPYRACLSTFGGLVDVPADADPARRAFVRVRLQPHSALACEPADLPFEITRLDV